MRLTKMTDRLVLKKWFEDLESARLRGHVAARLSRTGG